MEKPIHTFDGFYYEIMRPCLWFASGSKIDCNKFQEYFTQQAIRSLLADGFIQVNKKQCT